MSQDLTQLVEYLKVLNDLLKQKVNVYREINQTNTLIQAQLNPPRPYLAQWAERHTEYVTYDELNQTVWVKDGHKQVREVLQLLRLYPLPEVAERLELSEVQVSNVLYALTDLVD